MLLILDLPAAFLILKFSLCLLGGMPQKNGAAFSSLHCIRRPMMLIFTITVMFNFDELVEKPYL
jgi:hypothetical protein